MHSRSKSFLAKSGVTCDQFLLLHIMSRTSATTQETLVARATLDPAAAERLLIALEARGIVGRQWYLTGKGHRLYKRLQHSRRRRARKSSASKKALERLVA